MSSATKKKHVQKELLSREFRVPDDVNHIVQITTNAGNNLHQIVTPSGEKYIVSMPGKFRNNIWIKPGDFVIVKPIEEGNKVRGEIDQILDKQYIHFLKSRKSWPFNESVDGDKKPADKISNQAIDCGEDSDIDELENGNLNRRKPVENFSSSEEED